MWTLSLALKTGTEFASLNFIFSRENSLSPWSSTWGTSKWNCCLSNPSALVLKWSLLFTNLLLCRTTWTRVICSLTITCWVSFTYCIRSIFRTLRRIWMPVKFYYICTNNFSTLRTKLWPPLTPNSSPKFSPAKSSGSISTNKSKHITDYTTTRLLCSVMIFRCNKSIHSWTMKMGLRWWASLKACMDSSLSWSGAASTCWLTWAERSCRSLGMKLQWINRSFCFPLRNTRVSAI